MRCPSCGEEIQIDEEALPEKLSLAILVFLLVILLVGVFVPYLPFFLVMIPVSGLLGFWIGRVGGWKHESVYAPLGIALGIAGFSGVLAAGAFCANGPLLPVCQASITGSSRGPLGLVEALFGFVIVVTLAMVSGGGIGSHWAGQELKSWARGYAWHGVLFFIEVGAAILGSIGLT